MEGLTTKTSGSRAVSELGDVNVNVDLDAVPKPYEKCEIDLDAGPIVTARKSRVATKIQKMRGNIPTVVSPSSTSTLSASSASSASTVPTVVNATTSSLLPSTSSPLQVPPSPGVQRVATRGPEIVRELGSPTPDQSTHGGIAGVKGTADADGAHATLVHNTRAQIIAELRGEDMRRRNAMRANVQNEIARREQEMKAVAERAEQLRREVVHFRGILQGIEASMGGTSTR